MHNTDLQRRQTGGLPPAVFRQPLRIFILFLFFFAVFAPALFFAMHYVTDREEMNVIYETYSPPGTIQNYMIPAEPRVLFARPSGLTEIEPEVLRVIADSPNVSTVDRRITRAARINDLTTLNLFFLVEDAPMINIFGGLVVNDDFDFIKRYGTALFRDVRFYTGHPDIASRSDIPFNYDVSGQFRKYSKENPPYTVGSRYLNIAVSMFGHNNGRLEDHIVYLWSEQEEMKELRKANDLYFERILPNAIQPLPDDATKEDVREILDEFALGYLLDQGDMLLHAFTVHTTADMRMLLPYAQGRMILLDGRPIVKSDQGDHVCVISSLLAEKNGIGIGDRIDISLADDCYNIEGYQYGRNSLGGEMYLPYGDPEPFEIIGTFDYTDFSAYGNPFLFSYNDIFIPGGLISAHDNEEVYPYSFSFRVRGDSLDDFYNTEKTQLEALGYQVQLLESSWNDVRSIYEDMASRQTALLTGAGFFFICGSLLFLMLLVRLNRREYALRKLLGAPEREAKRALMIPFYLSAVPAALISVLSISAVYILYLRPQKEALLAGSTVPLSSLLPLLFLYAVLQIIFGRLILLLFHIHLSKQQIRVLL